MPTVHIIQTTNRVLEGEDAAPDGNDNTVIDTPAEDTNAGSDEVTEEEMGAYYYYYTYTDGTEDSAPDGNDNTVIETPAEDTNAGSEEVTEEEEIYYYYYTYPDDTDASTPDGNDNTVIDTSTDDTNTGSDEVSEEAVDSNAEVTLDADDKIEGTDTSIAEGTDGRDSVEEQFTSRRCPLAYLTKNTIHMDDLSFTFAIEADATMVDEVITKARSGLLDNISDTSLACAVNRKRRLSGRDHPAGIYEIRYLEKEDMKKVSECYQSIHGNSCFVYTGILRLISDQTITLDEHNLVSTRIQNYVNSVEIGVDNVSSSVYLGPEIPHVSLAPKNNTVDHSAVAISVSFFIALLLFVVYNYKISRTRKRRVTFNLEE